MVTADVHPIGGETRLEGVLRLTRGQYWVRQGFGRVLLFTSHKIESMVGKRIVASGRRARTRGCGPSKDAVLLTSHPHLAPAGS